MTNFWSPLVIKGDPPINCLITVRDQKYNIITQQNCNMKELSKKFDANRKDNVDFLLPNISPAI